MSDQVQEKDQSNVIDGGGLLRGTDKKLSLRRLMGVILMSLGVLELNLILIPFISFIKELSKNTIGAWDIVLASIMFFPGILMMIISLFIMRQITAQNIAAIAGKKV